MWLGLALAACGGEPAEVAASADGESSSGRASSDGPGTPTTTAAEGDSAGSGAVDSSGSSEPPDPTGGSTGGGATTDDDGGSTTGAPPGTFEACFEAQFVNPLDVFPDYDQFDPVIGTHCLGTNHQEITGVERVVFLGDSVTVGSRPTTSPDFYRSRLADALRDQWGLQFADPLSEALWKAPDPTDGQSIERHSGAFSSCAEWGARNDDLLPPGNQMNDCFSEEQLQARTLVVMTVGGNDLARLARNAIEGDTSEELWAFAEQYVQLHRDAVQWLTEPGRFPNGVFVVFGNLHEYTDGTGDVQSCPAASLAGFDGPLPNPEEFIEIVVWSNEQYMQTAVDTGTDMMLLLESFCGHGFARNDPEALCYRGPDMPAYLDATCIHPNPAGHGVIADNFLSVINE